MYLDFTYFAKQDSDWLSISSLISMFGYRGGLDGEASLRNLKCIRYLELFFLNSHLIAGRRIWLFRKF